MEKDKSTRINKNALEDKENAEFKLAELESKIG